MQVHEIEISYSSSRQLPDVKVLKSEVAEQIFRQNWQGIGVYESFYALHINQANKLVGIQKVGVGGIHSVVVDIRLILATSLKCLATGILVAHNHPTGSLIPSQRDKQLTSRLAQACKLFDIRLLDHLILHPFQGYFSFADEGILPTG